MFCLDRYALGMLSEANQARLEEEGFCLLPNLLTAEELDRAQSALDAAVARLRAQERAFDARLDPNAANIRVYNLPNEDPVFVDLLRHPAALDAARAVLGPHVLVSNFTANIALPGSGSMNLHADQALVVPPPWHEPWAMNVIWCLDDVDEENGATRYLPGSHRFRTFADVPEDAVAHTRAFRAPAGSAIAMEGRLWHTSGANISKDRPRRMMFAYYSADFIRQQVNWDVCLSAVVRDGLDAEARALFGMGPAANTRIGGALTRRS